MSLSVGERISVCLLTYNHVEVIESTIRTILDQSVSGYEIVVSDDSSTDGTWELILALAENDERIRPVRTPHNMGMPGNANFAVAQSKRPYIALLHHDDIYRKDMLERWSEVLDRFPDVAFVFNSYGLYGQVAICSEAIAAGRIEGKWLLENFFFPRWGCAVHGTAMIRRESWDLVGGMREQFSMLADVDLWMRLAMCRAVGYVPEPLITIRHVRPSYYPNIYKEGGWSWHRQRYLYEIHAANRLVFYNLKTISGRLKWWWFRLRLSNETARWLAYAVVKHKLEMITSSHESVTKYDVWPLRVLRRLLQRTVYPLQNY